MMSTRRFSSRQLWAQKRTLGELNAVGSIGSGRALEGAIVYGMGNMGSKR
jgi:hypothetical protein